MRSASSKKSFLDCWGAANPIMELRVASVFGFSRCLISAISVSGLTKHGILESTFLVKQTTKLTFGQDHDQALDLFDVSFGLLETCAHQALEVGELVTIEAIHQVNILLCQFEWCGFEAHPTW